MGESKLKRAKGEETLISRAGIQRGIVYYPRASSEIILRALHLPQHKRINIYVNIQNDKYIYKCIL